MMILIYIYCFQACRTGATGTHYVRPASWINSLVMFMNESWKRASKWATVYLVVSCQRGRGERRRDEEQWDEILAGRVMVGLFFYFTQAFDCVYHIILLDKDFRSKHDQDGVLKPARFTYPTIDRKPPPNWLQNKKRRWDQWRAWRKVSSN